MTVLIDEAFLRANPLPLPAREGSKQHRGRVLVVAGSASMPGAALLAASGVLRAGAGILQIATCRSVAVHVGIAMPEALVVGCDDTPDGGMNPAASHKLAELARESDVVLVGPGMVGNAEVRALTRRLLSAAPDTTFVIDALAIGALNEYHEPRGGPVVMTPHAGEMAAFLGCDREAVEADPLRAGMDAVKRSGAVVVMKGAQTFVAAGDGRSWVCTDGTIGLATSGSGDVLAGIVAGLLARGAAPTLAAAWGVFLHASAGQRLTQTHGAFGLLAREIAGEVPALMDEIAKIT